MRSFMQSKVMYHVVATLLVLLSMFCVWCQGGYVVSVHTADENYADSKANVYIYMFGHLGSSGLMPVKAGVAGFYRGSVVFMNVSEDYGVIHQVTIQHDNANEEPAWKVEKVEIYNDMTGERRIISVCLLAQCWIEQTNLSITLKLKVNGKWSWSDWSSCSSSCGLDGVKTRTASCTNPPPRNGGVTCQGNNWQNMRCNRFGCPVNGSWSWGRWTYCSTSCGKHGIRVRSATCTSPPPSGGGLNCTGDDHQIEECNRINCSVLQSTASSPSMNLSECMAMVTYLLQTPQTPGVQTTQDVDTTQGIGTTQFTRTANNNTPHKHPVIYERNHIKRQPREAAAAVGIGTVALIAVIAFIAGIVILDSSNLVSQTMLLKRNICHLCGVPSKSRRQKTRRVNSRPTEPYVKNGVLSSDIGVRHGQLTMVEENEFNQIYVL